MSFDIDKALEDIVNETRKLLGEDWPELKDAMQTVLDDEKEALNDIARARINGDITDGEMNEQLEYEKHAFIAGLSMVSAVRKATIQRVVNLATELFVKAVIAAL